MVFRLRPAAIRPDLVLKILLLWLLVLFGFWASRYFLRSTGDVHIQDMSVNNGLTHSIQPIVPGDVDLYPTPSMEARPKQHTAKLPDKIIVMGKMASEDTTWVEEELPE
jgi:hypothetical protein